MKKPSKAKKSRVKKASKKTAKKTAKKAAKKIAKKTAKKAAKKAAKKPAADMMMALGCCTLAGSGPDQQFEGITKAECMQRATAAGKNPHWVAGVCAEQN